MRGLTIALLVACAGRRRGGRPPRPLAAGHPPRRRPRGPQARLRQVSRQPAADRQAGRPASTSTSGRPTGRRGSPPSSSATSPAGSTASRSPRRSAASSRPTWTRRRHAARRAPHPQPAERRPMRHLLASLWRTHVTEVAERINAESRAYLAATPPARADREAAVVLLTALVGLILINFFGRPGTPRGLPGAPRGAAPRRTWADRLQAYLSQGFDARIHQRTFWAVTRALGYVGVPAPGHLARPPGVGGRLRIPDPGHPPPREDLRGDAPGHRPGGHRRLVHHPLPADLSLLPAVPRRAALAPLLDLGAPLRLAVRRPWSSSSAASSSTVSSDGSATPRCG